jgi:penicillin-binding protein 2
VTGDSPRLRLAVIGIIGISLFTALVARMWYLQVLASPSLKLQAQENSVRTVLEPAPRGRILDRNGVVMVGNRASNVVAIDRLKLAGFTKAQRSALLDKLSQVLSVSVPDLEKRLASQQVSPYTPVPMAQDVDETKMVVLRERQDEFPGVVAQRVAVRTYPFGSLGAHLLGYVGEISQTELAKAGSTYALGDKVGKDGVEKTYETELRGTPGEEQIEVDRQGRPIRVVASKPPVQGLDVRLSIDVNVQQAAETALAEGLAATRGHLFKDDRKPLVADAGSVVALDVKEGSVLALASYPTFDLPGLADGISDEEAAVLFPKDQSKAAPFLDRAIAGVYLPGSTWKLVTADAALSTGLITANTTVNDTGQYTIPGDCTGNGCRKRNAGGASYGLVDVRKALAVSSDVFFYKLGGDFWQQRAKYGDNPMQTVAASLGFGADTGVPLPGEVSGRVLTKASKNALAAQNKLLATPGWYAGDNVNTAIGQETMQVTPIQLANAYATYANGGTLYALNIALDIQKANGEIVKQIDPRVASHVDIPPAVRQPIVDGLTRVVSDPKGTAYNAFQGFPLSKWGIAGKTGTAQAEKRQDDALFVGWGPTADPHYAVSVVMEQSGFSATSAAPVARRVFGVISGLETQGTAKYTPVNGTGE